MKQLAIAGALAMSSIFVGIGAGPASAAISPPESAATIWNCDSVFPGMTVTGLVGDTFTFNNTSSSAPCQLVQMVGIVTASDNVGPVTEIAAGATVTFTIVGPGQVLISGAGGGLSGFTVVVADPEPTPDPEPTESPNSLPNTGAPDITSIALTALAGAALVGAGVSVVNRRRGVEN